MTDTDYAHIAIVADRSGSMGDVADPPHTKAQRTTEGIHALVREQRSVPGRVTFSLTDFDTEHTAVESFGDGGKILSWQCRPRNGTALLDAVGMEITRTGEQLSALPEGQRPGRVFFVIGTDGEENSSREYSLDQVKAMVSEQRDTYGWEFIFLGADIDAFDGASAMGMATASAMPYVAAATMDAFAVTSEAIGDARTFGGAVGYNIAQRQRVQDAGKTKS